MTKKNKIRSFVILLLLQIGTALGFILGIIFDKPLLTVLCLFLYFIIGFIGHFFGHFEKDKKGRYIIIANILDK